MDYLQKRYLRKPSYRIISQRMFRFFHRKNYDKDDDDEIQITRQPPVTQQMFAKLTFNLSSTQSRDVENNTTPIVESSHITNYTQDPDDDFQKKCLDAMNLCKRYALIFFIFEKFAFGISAICPIFAMIISVKNISVMWSFIVSIILLLIIVFNSLGDWVRLREKYARLYHLFKVLSVSKDEDRIEKFKSYSITFGSSDLFIDTIVLNER